MIAQLRLLGQCTFRSEYPIRAPGFQYVSKDACPKLDYCQYPVLVVQDKCPDLPGYTSHVSISWALPQALASWDILLRHGMRPGRLLLPQAERARDGFSRSVYPFGVTLGGCFTPGSIWVHTTHDLAA